MAQLELPRPTAPIAGEGGLTPVEWYDFFLSLTQIDQIDANLQAELAALADRVAALEAGSGLSATINGWGSVQVNGSLAGGLVQITLEGDQETPGPSMFYGTDDEGNKGWREHDGYGISTLGTWQWAPGATTPSWGQVSTGTETSPALATEIIFNRYSRNGQDHAGLQKIIGPGWVLWAQAKDNADSWGKYLVTGVGTPAGTDAASFPVVLLEAGSDPLTGWTDVNILLAGAVPAPDPVPSYLPMTTGEISGDQPVFVYGPDGRLIYAPVT